VMMSRDAKRPPPHRSISAVCSRAAWRCVPAVVEYCTKRTPFAMGPIPR
jgi:hypothetical protein